MRTDIITSQLPINENAYIDPSFLRTSPRRIRAIFIRSLWTIAVVIVLLLLALTGYIYYSAWTFTHPRIAPLYSDPMAALQLPYSDIEFLSMDGESTMNGWYIPSTSKKTIIFSHGYAGNREEIWVPLYELAQALHSNHYNVIMFDYGYVNQQLNPSRVMTAGVNEAGELMGAVQYAKQLGGEQIYIWGFSMGAGTALQAALEPAGIDGMILDSTFLLQPGVLDNIVLTHFPFARNILLHVVDYLLPFTGGVKLSKVPHEEVNSNRYSIPLFMIHGLKDTQAPYTITKRIFEQQFDPRSVLWLPADRGHEMTYRFQSEEYVERTLHFLNTISQSPIAH
ncbi:MAG: alpha/beta hydrolase [Paenibacillaceae bacterium]